LIKTINEDLTSYLKQITAPTLLLWGENDHDTPIEFGQRMKSLIPILKFVVLAGAGHFSS